MEEQTNTTTTRAGLRYGLIFGLISVISMLIKYMAHLEKIFSLFDWTYFIIMVVMALLYYRSNNNGLMTYGQGVSTGMAATGVASIIRAFGHLIYISFIDKDYTRRQLDLLRIELEKNPDISDEQINQMLSMGSSAPTLAFLGMIFGLLLLGLVISLIVAAILKKENKEF